MSESKADCVITSSEKAKLNPRFAGIGCLSIIVLGIVGIFGLVMFGETPKFDITVGHAETLFPELEFFADTDGSGFVAMLPEATVELLCASQDRSEILDSVEIKIFHQGDTSLLRDYFIVTAQIISTLSLRDPVDKREVVEWLDQEWTESDWVGEGLGNVRLTITESDARVLTLMIRDSD